MSLSVKIKGDATGFHRAAHSVKSSIKSIGVGAMKMGAAIGAAGIAGVAAVGALGVKLALMGEELATAEDRIKNINKQMGLFGSESDNVSKRMIALAKATSVNIGVDAKSIMMTQAKLATFAELAATADEAGGSFDRATQAALDMAAAGFGDAESNAVQLGKALQDPIKGITALARSGVTFTAQEKAKIAALVASNKMLEAQEMILKAVEKQVGGTAAATANGSDRMKAAFTLMLEEIGKPLASITAKLADLFVQIVPKIQAMMEKIAPTIRQIGGLLSDALSEAVAGDTEKLGRIGQYIGDVLVVGIKSALESAANGIFDFFGDNLKFTGLGVIVNGLRKAGVVDQQLEGFDTIFSRNSVDKFGQGGIAAGFDKLTSDNNGARMAAGREYLGNADPEWTKELLRLREETAKQTKALEEMNRNLVPSL
jgi:hypothetical protein